MKILSFILIVLTFITYQKIDVIGSWTNCSTGDGKGMQINYNVCPVIDFKENGRGIINSKYEFHWTIKDQTIIFSSDSKDATQFFGNNLKFQMKSYSDSKLQYLKLIDDDGNWFLLAK